MFVFGRSVAPSGSPVAVGGKSREEEEVPGGETRYARPWRPVKPLLIMEVVGMRSARQREQRRCEVGWERRKEVGCVGGDEGGVDEVVLVEFVEERRRRKGMLGRR